MKFDIETDDDDRPIQPKSILQPMATNSRAIRYRLIMLFGCLLMVVIAMKEAGKPERWEWMKFQNSDLASEVDNQAPTATIDPENDADRQTAFVSNTNSANRTSGSDLEAAQPPAIESQAKKTPAEKTASFNANTRLTLASSQPSSDYPAAANRFWESLMQKLSSNQQQDFLRLLKSMRRGQKLGEAKSGSYSKLVKVIASQREKFHQELFDRVTLSPEGSPGKKQKSDELYESTELWERTVLPALNAAAMGDDFTISQQQAIKRLQLAIDPLVFSQASDQTPMGWSGDSETWKRLWEKTQEGILKSEPVDRIALMSQPEFYRGKPVKIQGWIRSVRRKAVPDDSELDFPHYYEMWIRPKETKLGTYCVYSTTLPQNSALLQNEFNSSTKKQFQTTPFVDANENVTIEGYFFKIRTYIAADETVRSSPVVMASNFETIAPIEFASVDRWQPSRTTLVVLFVLIPILATGLACWVFFTSRTKQYVPGKQRQKTISKTLGALATDPSVQTDREKIMSLYEPDSQDA